MFFLYLCLFMGIQLELELKTGKGKIDFFFFSHCISFYLFVLLHFTSLFTSCKYVRLNNSKLKLLYWRHKKNLTKEYITHTHKTKMRFFFFSLSPSLFLRAIIFFRIKVNPNKGENIKTHSPSHSFTLSHTQQKHKHDKKTSQELTWNVLKYNPNWISFS